jgi:signal transduction histidine kinase
VHEGLENTLLMFAHRLKNTRLERDYARDLPKITAYGSDLNLVWTNLIDNALDAMDDQGKLRLRTYEKDGWVTVEISDSGPGITPEDQKRIYEPFFTTKPLGVGTGLGLDIAYRIITERHNGYIDLDSEPGRTTFRVCLPEAGPAAQPAVQPAAQNPPEPNQES